MTNTEIEAFLTILREGSISGAAQALFVTQPALSRRVRSLEEELGYELFSRSRGLRGIELTEAGRQFVEVAERWRQVWAEARAIGGRTQSEVLRVSALDSVGTYLLPEIYPVFLAREPDASLRIWTLHSYHSYDYIEAGTVDLAFAVDRRYSRLAVTSPAFSEKMLFVCPAGSDYSERVAPGMLDPGRELRISWDPEYDAWHERWFGRAAVPRVFLDKMSLLEVLLRGQEWAIVPSRVASVLCAGGEIRTCALENAPPDRVCSLLTVPGRKTQLVGRFMDCAIEVLSAMPEVTLLLK